ncbi:TapB family protein [Chitinophaga silvisoli]|uniref:DUF3108 domain-containing protein n=1 Tax=Chitinophaga silvisoli TaxID=2291814 RepID=A0A3E1P7E1_9BACT|nr:hypothetical protein [Chitinophaga silvisoli]RFM36010.1 hypothetical protein DXN04_00375 [Chitinophaga silvisoli]
MKKKMFLAASLVLAAQLLYGQQQDCKSYYFLQNNAEVEMSIYDGNGKLVAKNIEKVLNVNRTANVISSNFSTTLKDENGKDLSTGKGKFKCTGAEILLDMQMAMPNIPQLQNMKMEGGSDEIFIAYPSTMKEGQALPGGEKEMRGNMNGMEISMTLKVSDRKVVGKEKVTTPAGTWECFKIAYKLGLSVQMMGTNFPMDLDVNATEWFAPGFGIVKTDTERGGSMLGSMKITAFKK